MDIDVNPYRELDAKIDPTEFEVFCMETLKAYAEREKLQNFSIRHNQRIESDDGTYQIDVIAEYTALGAKNVVIVECKKYSNSVKRDIVTNLHAKLQSIGAHKGIVISTVGYQRGTVQYAKKHGIALWQICDNYIKHISASADKHISDAMIFQLEVEVFLPKHFMLEWDCEADYPYTQLYPSEKMEQEAREKARNKRFNTRKV